MQQIGKTFCASCIKDDSFEDKSSEDESLEDCSSEDESYMEVPPLYITASAPRIADNDFIVRLIGEQFNKLKHGDLIDTAFAPRLHSIHIVIESPENDIKRAMPIAVNNGWEANIYTHITQYIENPIMFYGNFGGVFLSVDEEYSTIKVYLDPVIHFTTLYKWSGKQILQEKLYGGMVLI